MSLPKAAEALETGDHASALSLVLESWALCKHPRITAVIEELSRRVAKTRQPPGGKKVVEKQAAWLELAAKRDPGDLEHLLAALTAIAKKAELEARLTALEGRADPRIATALHALLEHPPIPGSTGREAVRQALRLVGGIRDPRSVAALDHIATVNAEGGGTATSELRAMLPLTRTTLVAMSEPVLTPEQSYLLDVIEVALGSEVKRDPAALFAAVYANPDDDGPRAVLADLLQELGDPRGEFIALQLARGRGGNKTRREAALVKEHGRAWLGPLAPAIPKDGVVFERGFLAKCRTISEYGLSGAETICACVEWATVEELQLGPWEHVQLLVDAMPALRVLAGVDRGEHIPSHPRLEEMRVKFLLHADVDRLCSRELPALRSLSIQFCYPELHQMVKFLSSSIGTQLRRLELQAPDAEEWVPVFATRGLECGVISQTGNPWWLRFEDGRITCTYYDGGHPHVDPEIVTELRSYLVCVPIPSKWHVTVRRDISTLEGIVPVLELFASYTVEP